MNYSQWSIAQDLPLSLELKDTLGNPISGVVPQVAIRRATDGYYYTNTGGWQIGEYWFNMTPYGDTYGVYRYLFQQSQIHVAETYTVYYKSPPYYTAEIHIVIDPSVDVYSSGAK